MGGHRRQVTRDHQGVLLPVCGVGRDAAVLRCGDIDVVCADLVPDLLGVARRSVAVEVSEVTVDFIQVPLLRERKEREKMDDKSQTDRSKTEQGERKMDDDSRTERTKKKIKGEREK